MPQASFQIEEAVKALESFLSIQAVSPERIVVIQDVFRDFCDFIDKDPISATAQDFAVYGQLHAHTSDQRTFTTALNLIQSFCQSQAANQTVEPEEKPVKRMSKATCHFDASPELLEALFAPEFSEKEPKSAASSGSATISPSAKVHTDDVTANPGLQLDGGASIDRSRAKSPRSISQSFDQFDFSIDKNLADELVSDPHNAATGLGENRASRTSSADFERISPLSSSNNRPVPSRLSSGGYRAVQSPSGSYRSAQAPNNNRSDLIANELLSESQLAKNDAPRNVPVNNDLLRGVDNIDYDFSRQNIRNIRESQKQQPVVQETDAPAASENHSSSWLFEDKYEIDIPMPDPQKLQPCKVTMVQRFLIPSSPAIVVAALALGVGSVIPMAGIGLILIAIVCLIVALPLMKSPSQETPQAALTTSLNARAGACVVQGLSVIARPTADAEDPNLVEIWQENAPNFVQALINRFRPIQTPKTRIVSGSDSQNSLILLYTTETNYYLAPMVRLDNKWYLATPMPRMHKL